MSPITQGSLVTRASLLARLKDWDNERSWQEFFDTYWPFIFRVALKSGLTEAEAEDAVQETLLALARSIKSFQYDPKRCSFKSWLMLLARQRIIWQLRKRTPARALAEDTEIGNSRTSAIDGIPDLAALEICDEWEKEWQRNLWSAALERVKQKVSSRLFQIFDLYVLQEWPAADVAQTLRINVARVYLAKHRVSAVVRDELKRLQRLGNVTPVGEKTISLGRTRSDRRKSSGTGPVRHG